MVYNGVYLSRVAKSQQEEQQDWFALYSYRVLSHYIKLLKVSWFSSDLEQSNVQ